MHDGRNIVLIGFMGTGKSAIGRKLARKLGMEFMDIDKEIESLVGMSIKDIFKECGEKRFRSEERLMVEKAARRRNTVISTGGGVVLDEHNMEALRDHATVVALFADPAVIHERISRNDRRPLVRGASKEDIRRKMAEREALYRQAPIQVDTTRQSLDATIDSILKKIRAREATGS